MQGSQECLYTISKVIKSRIFDLPCELGEDFDVSESRYELRNNIFSDLFYLNI